MSKKTSFVYHVEVLIEENHHAKALEQLISKLNNSEFTDYKIISGIQLGQEIDARKNKATATVPASVKASGKHMTDQENLASTSIENTDNKSSDIDNQNVLSQGLEIFREYKSKNKLIRLIVNRGLGIKVSIPCRVINIDENEMIITVYHVDEKQVYTFRLNEIEDFN